MPRRTLARVLLAALAVSTILAVTPGHAAQAPGTAKSCSGTACTFTDRVGDAGSIDTDGVDSQLGRVDMITSSLSRDTLAGGRESIRATYVVNGVIPQPDVAALPPSDGTTGWSFRTLYVDAGLLDNNPHQACERATSPHPVTGDPTYIYPFVAHHADGYRQFVSLDLEYFAPQDGTPTYRAGPKYGYFDPNADGGFFFNEVNPEVDENPLAPSPTRGKKGVWYDYGVTNHANGTSTVSFEIARSVAFNDVNCKGDADLVNGNGTDTLALDNAKLSHISPTVWSNITVSGAGGLISREDTLSWGPTYGGAVDGPGDRNYFGDSDAYYPGVFTSETRDIDIPGSGTGSPICDPSLGDDCSATLTGFFTHNMLSGNAPGPECWTPTFGGTLPKNPLHRGSAPCAIGTPFGWGEDWTNTGAAWTTGI